MNKCYARQIVLDKPNKPLLAQFCALPSKPGCLHHGILGSWEEAWAQLVPQPTLRSLTSCCHRKKEKKVRKKKRKMDVWPLSSVGTVDICAWYPSLLHFLCVRPATEADDLHAA